MDMYLGVSSIALGDLLLNRYATNCIVNILGRGSPWEVSDPVQLCANHKC